MTARDYLEQAKLLDNRINTKIRQVEELNDLATRATSVLTGMPRSHDSSQSIMANCVTKIVDLQNEIDQDISDLVDLKADIAKTISEVGDPELQEILEWRYLFSMAWDAIAVRLGYSRRWVLRKHVQALLAVDLILEKREERAGE